MTLKTARPPVMMALFLCGCAAAAQTPTFVVAPNPPPKSNRLYCALSLSDPQTCFSPPLCEERIKIGGPFHGPDYAFREKIGDHTGIDITVPAGTPVFAAADGVVIQAGPGENDTNIVSVRVEDGANPDWTYRLLHLSKIAVAKGERVNRGQFLGLSGGEVGAAGSGPYTQGAHLHFDMLYQGNFADPQPLLCRSVK